MKVSKTLKFTTVQTGNSYCQTAIKNSNTCFFFNSHAIIRSNPYCGVLRAASCVLRAVCCMMYDSLFAVCFAILRFAVPFIACFLLQAACCVQQAAYCVLYAASCVLHNSCCVLFVVRYLLYAVCYVLPAVCCVLRGF